MKKTIFLGDTHGRPFWKSIIDKEKPDRVIFIGDYFDSYDFSGIEQIANFKDIIRFKEENPQIEIILLTGNHDFHYFPEIGYSQTSGYQAGIATDIEFVVNENRKHLQMAYSLDNILCTHAGVGKAWIDRILKYGFIEDSLDYTSEGLADFVNQIWTYKPKLFGFTGMEPTGDNMGQTPIWIRPRSLMKDGKEFKKNGIIQIVGHTQQNQIDIEGKATGGKYYFIDTLETSGEYLIYVNGLFSINNIKNKQ